MNGITSARYTEAAVQFPAKNDRSCSWLKLKERDWKIRSTKVDADDFKQELLNRLRSTMANNVLRVFVHWQYRYCTQNRMTPGTLQAIKYSCNTVLRCLKCVLLILKYSLIIPRNLTEIFIRKSFLFFGWIFWISKKG